MSPTRTTANRYYKSTPTTNEPLTSPAPHPRTVEVLAWLTERLDWEDHLELLHGQYAKDHNAHIER
jgi:hypothetical protein